MAVLTRVDEQSARELLNAYAVGDFVALEGLAAGSVNSNFRLHTEGGTYFLRLYEEQDFDGARRDVELLAALSQVATPTPVMAKDGLLCRSVCGKPAAIFPWIAGAIRCQRLVSSSDTHMLGGALASLHQVGESLSPTLIPDTRFGFDNLLQRLDRIAREAPPELARWEPQLRRELENVHRSRAGGTTGLIHGDLFRDNVLWNDDGSIAALLDFESASRGSFAYDIMTTMLAWCVGDELSDELACGLLRGYAEVRPLPESDIDALHAEGMFAALRFTITRITDFAMRKNEGPAVVKDWRRFWMRYEALKARGEDGVRAWVE